MASQNKPESPSSDAGQPQVGKSSLTAMKHEFIKNMEGFFDRAWWESFSLKIREELDRRFYSGKKLSPEEKAEAEAAKAKEMTDKEEEIKGVFDLLQELAEWGIKLGAQEPKSELYKTAIEFSDLLDTMQSNLPNCTQSQRLRCKTLLNRLYFLLEDRSKNRGGKQRKPMQEILEEQKSAGVKEQQSSTDIVHINLNDFSESGSYKLLCDLLADSNRKGITLDSEKYGKKQPKNLKDLLREKKLGKIGKKITTRDNVVTLRIPTEKISSIPKKSKKY